MSLQAPAFTAQVNYKMRSTLEVFCTIQKRVEAYNNLKLNDDELVADTVDEVAFIAYVTRADDPDKKPIEGGYITRVDIVTDDPAETPAFDYEILFDDDSRPGKFGKLSTPVQKVKGIIKSKKPVYYTYVNAKNLKLNISGVYELSGDKTNSGKIIVNSWEQLIYPKLIKLFMWVLPGKEIFTSEIWATIRLLPMPVQQQNWETVEGFRIHAQCEMGDQWIYFDTGNEVQKTKQELYSFAQWVIRYDRGEPITWENVNDTDIGIKVSVYYDNAKADRMQGLVFNYNIGDNIKFFLKSFKEKASQEMKVIGSQFNFYNPYFDEIRKVSKEFALKGDVHDIFMPESKPDVDPGTGEARLSSFKNLVGSLNVTPISPIYKFAKSDHKLDIIVRAMEALVPYSKGPLNDALNLIGKMGSHYLCAEITDRIFSWSSEKKFGTPAHSNYDPGQILAAQEMNGVELAKSAISRVHVFFGFYPSSPKAYIKYIDPWWEQDMDINDFVCTIEHEVGKAAAFSAVVGGYIAVLYSLTGIPAGFLAALKTVAALGAGTTTGIFAAAGYVENKNYFRMGEIKEDYMMPPELKIYSDYSDGSNKNAWPGKIILSGLLGNQQFHGGEIV